MSKKLDAYKVGKERDRRRRLSDEARAELLQARGTMSQRAAARAFGVSRRLVSFVWFPEKLERQKELRKGVWAQYYTTASRREYMRGHRAYKRALINKESR